MSEYIQFPNGKRIDGPMATVIAAGFLALIFAVGFVLGAVVVAFS